MELYRYAMVSQPCDRVQEVTRCEAGSRPDFQVKVRTAGVCSRIAYCTDYLTSLHNRSGADVLHAQVCVKAVGTVVVSDLDVVSVCS